MTSTHQNATDPIYAMGRTYREYQRLIDQAEMLAPATERVLRAAGVGPGMRVLDVGSGVGDVAFLAARLVGPTGSVVGVDLDGAALDVARQRARDLGMSQVTFVQGDLRTAKPGASFDAAIGRLVLMYTADPKEALRAIARHVRSGGLLAFHELAFRSIPIRRQGGAIDKVVDWFLDVFGRAGLHDDLGMTLYRDMREVGLLPESRPIVEILMDSSPQSIGHHNITESMRSILPLVSKFGLATEAEVGIDTLEARLREEHGDRLAQIYITLVGQWARKP